MMIEKHIAKLLLATLLLLTAPYLAQGQKQENAAHVPGKPQLFNNGWGFYKGDLLEQYRDKPSAIQWQPVELPHDWSIEGPFSEEWASATGFLPGGIGWYRKTFAANTDWHGKQVYIYFDGVYKNSEVWINGHFLGKRPNGFIPFEYDMSPYLNYKGNNTITVKVDHHDFADSRWYTGSGIYRNVYLIVKNRVQVGLWDVAFTTPQVTVQKALVNVDVNVSNYTPSAAPVNVKINLLDHLGKIVLTVQQNIVVKPGAQMAKFNGQVIEPRLWSHDDPALYRLQVLISQKGKLVDEVSQPVGIRSMHFDKDNGFFLNGKSLKLKGVCIHDDAGALGVAVPEQVWIRRLNILKQAGVNSLRMSHNPHADYLYDLCDKMGFLIMDEAFDEWELGKNKWVKGWNAGTPSKAGYHEYFKEWANRDLGDQVRRDRNHPSIIMWSIGNEIDYPNDPYTNEVLNTGKNPQIYGKGYLADHPAASQITPIAKQLVSVVKQFDQSRPVTAALAGVVMSNEVGFPEVLDVVGYNYQEYRYTQDHAKYPDRIIYGSENGMGRSAWNAVDSNQYISAQYLWTGIDYLGEAGSWPQRSNGAGLIDLAGFKKTEYYYRQSLWSDKPMVYLAVKKAQQAEENGTWSHRGAEPTWNWPDKASVRVECFTNCQETELFLNGKSLGKKTRAGGDGQIPSWIVSFIAGRLEVKGFNEGKEVCHHSINTSGEAAAISCTADQQVFSRHDDGLSQIEIQVTDQDGNPVYSAANQIKVTVTGPGKLIGLESGSHTSHEDYQGDMRQTLHGRLLCYVKTIGKPGMISITLNSAGLQTKTIQLQVK